MPDIADVAPALAVTADQPRADLITPAAGSAPATGKAPRPEVTGPEVTGAEFRNAMGHFATGVTVITSLGADGQPVGTTANAVSSLSLDPPLVLVCFDLGSLTLQAIRGHGAFVVNILAARQRRLSANFAHRGHTAAWDGVRHRYGLTGSSRLEDVLAVLDCTVEHSLPGGDHEIVVGRVRHVEISASSDVPLVYFRGGYASLAS
jgi:flavin reductase (DIM6/NTAB) family NADH-FMN oxidoreductase RutF